MSEIDAEANARGRRRPFLALPAHWFSTVSSRIVLSVLVATLFASLIVTWLSTRSIGAFMHQEIDRKFPAVLQEANDRMSQWYAQREIDVETFAHSRIVVDGFAELASQPDERGERRIREAVRTFLRFELERFPQFQALFILDAQGSTQIWVGRRWSLSPEDRARLATLDSPRIGLLGDPDAGAVQIASAPIGDTNTGLSLHAVVEPAAALAMMRSGELASSGRIYLVDSSGAVVLGADGTGRYDRPLPVPGRPPVVADYDRTPGERVVGSAMPFERFGWTLVVEESFEETLAPLVSVVREIVVINLGIVAIAGLIAYAVARSTVRPILALSDGVLRIATGDTGVQIPGRGRTDEIGVLARAFNEMMVQLNRNQEELEEKRVEIEDANHRLVAQNQELQRVNEVFEQLSITDDLTKLHNHRFFQDHLPREILRSDRTGDALSLVLFDIDDFKQLNDRHGHSVGDAVLRRVADVMNGEVREMDLLARYGGEEFALLASQTNAYGAVALAEKLRLAVAQARFSVLALDGPSELRVTVSAGVSTYAGDAKAFFNQADRALYCAKESGKDCVVLYREDDTRFDGTAG